MIVKTFIIAPTVEIDDYLYNLSANTLNMLRAVADVLQWDSVSIVYNGVLVTADDR